VRENVGAFRFNLKYFKLRDETRDGICLRWNKFVSNNGLYKNFVGPKLVCTIPLRF